MHAQTSMVLQGNLFKGLSHSRIFFVNSFSGIISSVRVNFCKFFVLYLGGQVGNTWQNVQIRQ